VEGTETGGVGACNLLGMDAASCGKGGAASLPAGSRAQHQPRCRTTSLVYTAKIRNTLLLLPCCRGDAVTTLMSTILNQRIAVGLAQLGATEASEAALTTARQQVATLDAAHQINSIFGFSPQRWRFYEGKILSYLGRSDDAWVIHDEALGLYPENIVGDPALIRFDRAISLIRDAQVTTGCQLAEQTLLDLPDEHRTDIFVRTAKRVLSAVPNGDRTQPAVRQYRQTLRTCAVVASA
jgi:hypothetical protein